jgi:hypothetical protein
LGIRKQKQAQLLFDTLGIFQWVNTLVTDNAISKTIKTQAIAQHGWQIKPEELNAKVWIPHGYRIELTPTTQQDFIISENIMTVEDWGYLLGIDITLDRAGQLLADAFAKTTQDGWSDGHSNFKPTPSDILRNMLTCINSDNEILNLYAPETRRSLSQQLTATTKLGIFGQHGTELGQLLKPGQLSVLVMNKLGDSIRLAILTSLIRAIMRTRMEASEISKQSLISASPSEATAISDRTSIPPCWIEVDEAQNILPAEKKTTATDCLIRLVREGRNYGISFVVTTQQPSSIDQRIMAQVDVLIVHKLSMQSDIDYISKNLKSALPEEVSYNGRNLSLPDILRSLDTGQALVSHVDSDRAYLVDIRPRISVHGGFGT